MSDDTQALPAKPLDLTVLHAERGAGVAERPGLVVVIDLGGLGHHGGEVVLEALARQRWLHPRPAPLVNLTIVGEGATKPDPHEREVARRMGDHMSAFVCVAEGSGIRARWVRGVVGAISRFSRRRVPIYVARSIAEGSAHAARELSLDPEALASAVTALRLRVAASDG